MFNIDPMVLSLGVIGLVIVIAVAIFRGESITAKFRGATLVAGGRTSVKRLKAGRDTAIKTVGQVTEIDDVEAGRDIKVDAGSP